jgi:tRNA splicing ligase
MKKYKIISILFLLFTIGAVQETFRILTSNDEDIANNRDSLIPMSIILTTISAILTILFWWKSQKNNS